MKNKSLLLISSFAIAAMFTSPALAQKVVGYTSLGARQTKGIETIYPTVNPATNKIYIFDTTATGVVTVVDGTTHKVTASIAVGAGGSEVAVNSTTNIIYALNGDQTMSVIDGSVDQVIATVPPIVQDNCLANIAVDDAANKVALQDPCSQSVYVLDGSSYQLLATIPVVLGGAADLQVNPATHLLYLVSVPQSEFVVVDLNAGTSTTVALINAVPQGIAIDGVLNRVYIDDNVHSSVYVFDATTNVLLQTLVPPSSPFKVAVNEKTHELVVTDGETIYFYHANHLVLDSQVKLIEKNTFMYISVNSNTNHCYAGVFPNNALAFIQGPAK